MFSLDENTAVVGGVISYKSTYCCCCCCVSCPLLCGRGSSNCSPESLLWRPRLHPHPSALGSGSRLLESGSCQEQRGRKCWGCTLSHTHLPTRSHAHLLSVVFVAVLVRSCSLLSSSSNGWRLMISTVWGFGASSRITTVWLSHSWNTQQLLV